MDSHRVSDSWRPSPARGPYRSPRSWRPTSLLLLLLVAFSAGVLVERFGWLPGSRAHEPAGVAKTFEPFWETWNLVQEHFVDRQAVDPQKMTTGAIRGMLNSLGDEGHTAYLTADEYRQMEQDLQGELEGIGARMTVRAKMPAVAGVLPNSPAQKAGLRAGDILLQVDHKDVSELPLTRIVSLVRGQPDTVVHLRVAREGEAKPLDFDIKRARIEIPTVTWHMLPGVPIAHIALQDFGQSAHDQLSKALAEAREAGAKGLVVDVRGNPGGLKDQAVLVTSLFLKDGVVFREQDAQGHQKAEMVKPDPGVTDLPLCLLIDQGTASSAEIFAGALQDHKRGELVGTVTFGTGTVLMPYKLRDGSCVLLAIGEWLTPDGRQIWHQGIKPDVEATLPEQATILSPETEDKLTADELAKSSDKQLLKGLDVLEKEMHLPEKP